MIIKLVLNPQTLAVTADDPEVTINEVTTMAPGEIFIELSIPESEPMDLFNTSTVTDPTGQ